MSDSPQKTIVLVGHCGPDSSYLRMTVSRAVKDAAVKMADDQAHLTQLLDQGAGLLLVNRVLDYGFDVEMGVDLIRNLRKSHPNVRTMLITNYPEVQQEAIAAGALPGFGKREMGSTHVGQLLQKALA
jgi:two-component system chemotaxis response regulator CheY